MNIISGHEKCENFIGQQVELTVEDYVLSSKLRLKNITIQHYKIVIIILLLKDRCPKHGAARIHKYAKGTNIYNQLERSKVK